MRQRSVAGWIWGIAQVVLMLAGVLLAIGIVWVLVQARMRRF